MRLAFLSPCPPALSSHASSLQQWRHQPPKLLAHGFQRSPIPTFPEPQSSSQWREEAGQALLQATPLCREIR